MALSNRIQLFTHRRNSDGTVDSICRQCLTTVAIEYVEPMLTQREREHICDLAFETQSHRVRPGNSRILRNNRIFVAQGEK